MVNQPDQDTQGVQAPVSKLARPEPPNVGQKRQRYSSPRPTRSINQPISAAFHGLLTRTMQRWRTELAFRLLSAAVALAIVSALIVTVLVAHAVTTGTSSPDWTPAMVQHPAATAPANSTNLKPTFPTPVTGKGSSTSSQPTGHSATSLQPTPASDDQGTLDVQITNIPDVVNNRSTVQIDVQTSEPNIDVQLQITYNAAPFYYTSRGDTTDDQGNASLNWNVRVRSLSNGNNAQATVIVVATDHHGQQATSQPMTVEITS